MDTKLALARDLMSCLGGIEVRLLTDGENDISELIQQTGFASAFPAITQRSVERYLSQLEPEQVYFLSGILELSYIAIRLPRQNKTLIVGPCRLTEFSESRLRGSLRAYPLRADQLRSIISYCRWQSVLSPEKFHQLGILLGRHVLDLPEPIPHQNIEYQWNRIHQPQIPHPEPYADVSRIRQIEMRYEASAALTEAVKHGNLGLALRMIQGIQPGATGMIRNPDPMRNAQNLCIVLNTQLRHALEERKIHPYQLDMVSNEIGQQIETLTSLEETGKFYGHILRRYCELALENHYAHLPPLSRQAVVYIKNHLTDNLTVKETAKALLVNANYLSGKFHQEVGMTFTDFVNQQRTAQAAALLRHTNLQIQQISAAVGYNNASHFARQFIHFYGISPRNFRSRRSERGDSFTFSSRNGRK